MLIKEYAHERQGHPRYSPPVCVAARKSIQTGSPNEKHINTAFAERQNLKMRMQMRRFTRLTNGFSKLLQNHKHAIALHYFHYNFIRKHQAIKTTPAVMTSVADKVWTIVDFVELMERQEAMLGGQLSDYKPATSKKNDGPTFSLAV
jgi:hypothetical protein